MKKFLVLCVIAMVIIYFNPKINIVNIMNLFFSTDNNIYSVKEIVKKNDDKIVQIETNKGSGSGIIIGNGLILTNHHVIDGITLATVIFNDGQKITVDGVVESDPHKDIAIIKTNQKFNKSGVVIRPPSRELSKGDKVVAIGSPQNLLNTVSEGIISGFRISDGVQVIQTTADVDHGSSGGGLFDESGQLIGVVYGTYKSQSANLNFVVATEEFIPMINRYISKEFTDIDASFSTNSSPSPTNEFLFIDGIALGMTREQVKSLSKGTLFKEEDNDTILNTDVSVYGLLAQKLEYKFQNDKLIKISVTYNFDMISKDQTYLKSTFDEIIGKVNTAIGEEHIYMNDGKWSEEKDGKSLTAGWLTTTYQVVFIVLDNQNSSDYAVLDISIPK